MTKYKFSIHELHEHWKARLSFIQSSIRDFDIGKENEARRLATSLRIMFHETSTSHPLIKHMKLKK